ncbi:S-layer family protein [Paenibacillus taihuensis]|uniref:S-layer family protein n=1 Tax=Paenibacillus taihuensis TaxID=1156355 RepID=A0A3D9SCG7_9BACL|nr:S-layer homology domain-containing protein [Paenibacillus taihuensis]REE90655.1 S-layer family protein [Paenibacillus taihuensis]
MMQRARQMVWKIVLVVALAVQVLGFIGGGPANASSNAWSSLGAGLNGQPRAIAVSGTDVYAGGVFTTAGGNTVNRIAKWDGSQWSSLGTGMDFHVFAVAAAGTDVYAGGVFGTAGGVATGPIAKWNGSSWSALGSGLSGTVYAIAVSGTDVYVGGSALYLNGNSAGNIAKWDGTSWSSLGTGLNNAVYTLAVSGTDVYAGGDFTLAGGISASHIAKWNGSSWSGLGTGVSSTGSSTVYAMAISENSIYVGGTFTIAGGASASRIAKWNGSSWSSLGSGVDNTVSALAVSGNSLYAGGDFITSGGIPVGRIATWDGSSWSSPGAGVNGSVSSIAVSNGDVYAGGGFTAADGNSANYIAKWTTASSVTAVPVITGTVHAGDTSVTGTAAAGATVTLSVNEVPAAPVTAVNGNWTVSGLTLAPGDTISVTAQSAGEIISAAATATVAALITNIAAFDSVANVSAGTAGSAVYADGDAVSAALLASHATVLANDGTITVPVTGWLDTDGYDASVAGSYTFTATLGSLPVNTTNTGGLTATVEVVVSPRDITAFDAIGDVSAGTAGSAVYVDGDAVSAALLASHATVTANNGAITVPVTSWTDTDGYSASVAGSYTFTATLGSLPESTTNTGGLTATVEVVVSSRDINAFDAIGDVSAGIVGAATYISGTAVSAALLASHATVAANGGTITVPVTGWTDTDGYNASVAGSYTFTATLGSLPASTTNTGGLTATVEVVVSPKNITAFDAIGNVSAGTAGSATYTDGTSVSTALLTSHATVTANGGAITVPVTGWTDTDGYNASVAGSYTFTATLGSLPASTTNTGGLTATVEVVVAPKDITAFDAIGDVSAGTVSSATYANGAAVSTALLASHTAVTANGGTIMVPVTDWTDMDGYSASIAGSYTFTATLGSLPASITNTGGLTATVEVVVAPKNIATFDAIADIAAGMAGAATYANGTSVSSALLASHATVTANGGTITVPVTSWTDTDGYNATVAGSYTFTATLGSLPASTTNTGSLTATVEVVVSPKNITVFDAIGDVSAGTAGSATYADGTSVSTALLASHATVTANGGTITVPVTGWTDTDGYSASVAGSYTFTATLGSLPASRTNTGGLTATLEVVVSPKNITVFDAIADVSAGTAGSATYADGTSVSVALLASHATVTANNGTITVPVTSWYDKDGYNATVPGSYTFMATLGSLPANTTNTDNLTAGIEVVVARKAGGSTTPVTDTPVTSTDGTLVLPAGKRGTVSLENEVVISIPANATDKELRLTIEKLLNTQELLTDRNMSASSIFEILKNFAENFHNPVTLTLSFDRAKLSGDQSVAVFYFDEAKKEWVEVPGGRINEDHITVEVNHFTKYGVFVMGQPNIDPPPLSLKDVAGHWAETNIKRAINSGIVAGYPDGTFAPNRTVTRAEFAVMLMNTLKPISEGVTFDFTDKTQIGSWAQQAVAQAVQAGIVHGYKDGSFRPNAEITRAEIVAMIANALKLNTTSVRATGFADDKNIPSWVRGAVTEVRELGLIEGKNNNIFDPAGDATRAEAVTILLRMWDYLKQSGNS